MDPFGYRKRDGPGLGLADLGQACPGDQVEHPAKGEIQPVIAEAQQVSVCATAQRPSLVRREFEDEPREIRVLARTDRNGLGHGWRPEQQEK
ncbi:hypothetical protein [Rhodovulum strictum]|uniref:Uncharacterized protein n=1 Tax=Rhodovulum strictum TaxID=58314 RepID=A0A844B5T8_9RHOB|nr:hypothetical protein [Rhodovulum strictum]MRH21050.1 hypothetical protein [Rhodovulum strictum]